MSGSLVEVKSAGHVLVLWTEGWGELDSPADSQENIDQDHFSQAFPKDCKQTNKYK